MDEAGTWIRGGLLFFSLVCGALVSMWVNSLEQQIPANSSHAAPTVEFTVPASGVAAELIGVEIDDRRMAYVRAAN
jgi:hypothetical protein